MAGPYFPDPAAEALRDTAFDSTAFLANENGNALEMLRYLIENSGGGRVHVGAREWKYAVATDFWLISPNQGIDDAAPGVATQQAIIGSLRDSVGWSLTSGVVLNVTGTGDFLDLTDPGTRDYFDLDASTEVVASPVVFGGRSHVLAVTALLGAAPTKLIAEFWMGFETNANDTAAGVGFNNIGGGAAFGPNSILIHSDGANFVLKAGGNSDTGAAIDLVIHKWKIIVNKTAQNIEWFMDDVSQGTVTLADSQDVWPMCFQGRAASNFLQVYVPLHVWYEV